jgi:hypothetical protein
MHNDSALAGKSGGGISAIRKGQSDSYMTGVNKNDALKELSEAKGLQRRLEEDDRIRS